MLELLTLSATPFKHDQFSNDYSYLKKATIIAIPLIILVGAIYYFWRHSTQNISFEQKDSLEHKIKTFIDQKKFPQAKSLIKQLSTSAEIAHWTDFYHESLCQYYLRQEFLTFAYAQALKVKNFKRDLLLVQIFIDCLKKRQFSVPWQLLNGLKESDSNNLKENLIEAAQNEENLALAFSPLSRLSSSPIRTKWLTHLASKIAVKYPEIASFIRYAIQSPEKRDPLLEEMIPILIKNNYLAPARAFTLLFFDEDKKQYWQQEIRNNLSKKPE